MRGRNGVDHLSRRRLGETKNKTRHTHTHARTQWTAHKTSSEIIKKKRKKKRDRARNRPRPFDEIGTDGREPQNENRNENVYPSI